MTIATHAPFLAEVWPIITTGLISFVLMKLIWNFGFFGTARNERTERQRRMDEQIEKMWKNIQEEEAKENQKTPDERKE